MSEINECTSARCLSADDVTKNNENVKTSQLQMIPPVEDKKNEILNTSVRDTVQSENKSSEVPNLPKDDMTKTVQNATTAIKDSVEVQESSLLSPVEQENNLSLVITKDDKVLISKLQDEIKETINERDMYQKKLAETEKKLADLEATVSNTINNADNNDINVHGILTELKNKLAETTMQLEDRGVVMANQEKQINALNHQVTTLKEVVAITRDLLQIRNTEVKHLQAEVDDMEARIAEEREKHNTMISKMDAAVRLNSDLKKEYETQLGLFKDLRIKYDEKITLLSEEKRAYESANQLTINQTEKK